MSQGRGNRCEINKQEKSELGDKMTAALMKRVYKQASSPPSLKGLVDIQNLSPEGHPAYPRYREMDSSTWRKL